MLRTILIVIAAGVGSYFGVQAMGTKVPLSGGTGDIYLAQGDKTVTPSLAPLAQGAKRVPRNLAPVTGGDSSGDSSPSTDSGLSAPVNSILPAPTPWPLAPSVTPTPSETPVVTPDTPDPTPWPEPEATESPDPSPSPIPTPDPTPAPTAVTVVINEIAWMGTATSSADEWIELFNFGEKEVDLGGWTLSSTEGAPNISLSGVISPGGYYLLERTDDSTISDIPASLIYTGALSNAGEILILKDSAGNTVDTVGSQPWINENGEISRKQDISSLERISAELPGNDASNWASNDGSVTVGSDAGGLPIKGTPGYKNSVSP